MREIIGFLVMMIASLLDPIRTPGYIISGWLVKNCGLAIVISVAWNALSFVVIAMLASRQEHSEPNATVFFASCCGAALATYITFLIASRSRKAKEAQQSKKDDEEVKK